jgi:zinc/manganese transport system permease protein
VRTLTGAIVEPGFFASAIVGHAIVFGAVVAVVCAAVGVFAVIRGHAFAGEALGDVGSTGGSGAYLVGVAPLWGFVGFSALGAGLMALGAARTRRGRDVDTGIVVGGALGLAALFLYLDATHSSTSGAPVTILFGSLFTVSTSMLPTVIGLGLGALVVLAVIYRVLLLTSLSPDLASARGVSARTVGIIYLLLLAVAVSLSAVTIGAVLSTALLIGPPAAALSLTDRPGVATVIAATVGVGCTWLGVLLAYDSYYWPPAHHGWPVSFFIVALVFASYLGARWVGGVRRARSHRERRLTSPATTIASRTG